MTSLDAHEGGKLALLVGANNIPGGERHGHLVGMACGLLVHAVNQVHGALGVVALELRLHPDREEFRAEIAFLDFAKVNVSVADGCVLRQVEMLVKEALRRVRVGIDDQRGLMNGAGRCAVSRCIGLGRFFGGLLPSLGAWGLGQRESGNQETASKDNGWLHSREILSANWFVSRHSVYRSETITWKHQVRRSSAASTSCWSRRFLRYVSSHWCCALLRPRRERSTVVPARWEEVRSPISGAALRLCLRSFCCCSMVRTAEVTCNCVWNWL